MTPAPAVGLIRHVDLTPQSRANQPVSRSALPELDLLVSGLSDYAAAAAQADSFYRTARDTRINLIALRDQARQQRDLFRVDAAALVKRGLIQATRVACFEGRSGHVDVAFDLLQYTALFRDCWPVIEHRTALRLEELDAAAALGEHFVRLVGERRFERYKIAEPAQIRRQAFTLMMRAYSETRRAVAYLCKTEAATERIAPTLYAGRGGRGKANKPTPSSNDPAPTVESRSAPDPYGAKLLGGG